MMIEEELGKLVAQHDLIQKTKDTFWNTFKIYEEECYDEFLRNFSLFQKSDLDLIVNNISIRLINYPHNTSLFAVRLDLNYVNMPTGFYICYFTLDGTVFDDVLDIY